METGKLLESVLPAERVKSRLIDVVAYASDAGFYHLLPKAVVLPVSEEEIAGLFGFSHQYHIPLTFRAAGTSLSGQSITDGILADLSRNWNKISIEDEGRCVRVQPGAIGAAVNAVLKKYNRKIGPDPASINSAMMGGIVSNNASGMCCGVSKNSYHTTKYIRFILPNGKTYSTENRGDYKRFRDECPDIYQKISGLREEIAGNISICNLIRSKYKTKNTVGYSVNAFIDYEDPLDILAHLLIGAEGTLGFISEAVLHTIPDYPAKATALLYFPGIYEACEAILPLTEAGAEAVELMDRASLRSVEHIPGIPDVIRTLPDTATALLVEFQAETRSETERKVEHFFSLSSALSLVSQPEFTYDAAKQAFLWKVRKGMFPSVGAVRASGTTVILEDIAFPVEKLGDAILDLQSLFKKHRYDNAIIFGHAKDGNIHFVVTQAFDSASEIERYNCFLQDVVQLVVGKYHGALKAEHGTGRNMAPFVETEWGPEIYRIMKALKETIDPENLLNPGVIINADKQAHIRNLKDLPRVEEEVDKCMECGFCEYKCPSRNLSLTPRRRIVVRREILKLKNQGKKDLYKELLNQYQYDGLDTCAVDGLCAAACPVDINTGALVKRLRRENHSEFANKVALIFARNFGAVAFLVKMALRAGEGINRIFGESTMTKFTKAVKKVIPVFPVWSEQLKTSSAVSVSLPSGNEAEVIYFPTCISRVMGGSKAGKPGVAETFTGISRKAGVNLIVPHDISGSCCGQAFSSKGFSKAFEHTANATIEKLWKWTDSGRLPVVVDISSCTHTLHDCRPVLSEENKHRFDQIRIIDSIDYILDYILPRAVITKTKKKVVLHPVCSLQKMGLEQKFFKAAQRLANDVVIPFHSGCCGMAGDRGFLFPELTHSATAAEAAEVKKETFDGYYSSAKTCEMALSEAVGKNYESLIYLVDECID